MSSPSVEPKAVPRLSLNASTAVARLLMTSESIFTVGATAYQCHAALASLTLLLPRPAARLPWELAGDAEAARMLVATLAAEWGAHGLRINALELQPGLAPDSCLPLLGYLAGARAQFLTGQVLRPGAGAAER